MTKIKTSGRPFRGKEKQHEPTDIVLATGHVEFKVKETARRNHGTIANAIRFAAKYKSIAK